MLVYRYGGVFFCVHSTDYRGDGWVRKGKTSRQEERKKERKEGRKVKKATVTVSGLPMRCVCQ